MTTRVVFVDDEPGVLDGIRLGLRRRRKTWDMVFMNGGEAAIAEIKARPVDVVVSDMRMPGMDGARLLSQVATIRPEAARIVLSGQMDETAAVRAACVAHRFLTKPCDASTLEATIVGALDLHAWLRSDRLRSSIGSLDSLPSLPHVYQALNSALSRAETSLSEVARIIEGDPGMAAKVLQLVNSSFFGLPRNMVNVAQAVSYLGVNTMKNLTLAESLFSKFAGVDVAALEREQSRSLLRARVARRLFSDSRRSEAASTSALLLDIGVLVLASRLPAEHSANVADARSRGLPLHEVERERLGVTHAEVGAYLLGLWGLPHEIVDTVARHHEPWSDPPELDVGGAVRVADGLVSELYPAENEPPAAALPEALIDRLGIATTVRTLRRSIVDSTEGT